MATPPRPKDPCVARVAWLWIGRIAEKLGLGWNLALPGGNLVAFVLLLASSCLHQTIAQPLTTLEYRVVGTQLRASPSVVTVPKNVQGSILVEFVRGDGTPAPEVAAAIAQGARVEASLRGPSFPEQRLIGEPGRPLLLPELRVTGEYQLDDIKLVRDGQVIQQATPASIPVRVFDEVLVSRVTSRPLTIDEIRDKGIAIDELNFRVVEFDVTLVLRGRQFRVSMPVVSPGANLSTEIIPAAELEERLAEAKRLNDRLARNVELPPEVQAEMPNFTINPMNFEEVSDGNGGEKEGIPITGLLVIPGNIGFLNQFFSVQLYTENAAPSGSGLSVNNVRATIQLPVGNDRVPASSYEAPGDDPLRMARVGSNKIILTNQPVVMLGPDNLPGTTDDVTRLQPGDTGTAEFLVEGLREGLHVLGLELEADLEGLAAGVTRIRGSATGSVLVRNAQFSMTFAHPATVRAGEPYEAAVTLLNTGDFTVNLVSVSLNKRAVSGAVLLSDEKVELGQLAPGESATATFRFRSQRTGTVLFSNLTTGDDNVRGRLSLFMGVDERGVRLNADSIGYPDWVSALPAELRHAANRVLGQALSVATAGRLPAHIRPITQKSVITRVVELAEAGQRLRYGDDVRWVLGDLALDWQGGRVSDPGFDQILRETNAGQEWRNAMALVTEAVDPANPVDRLREWAPSVAGLGQAWSMAAGSDTSLELSATMPSSFESTNVQPRFISGTNSAVAQSLIFAGTRGSWLAARREPNLMVTWRAHAGVSRATLSFLDVIGDGTARLLSWAVTEVAAGTEFVFAGTGGDALVVRDGSTQTQLLPSVAQIREEPPRVISVRQDISIVSDRDYRRCLMREYGNWGTVLAVLFSKPMRSEDVEVPSAYGLERGNGARTVKLQPGGRVCLLQLHRGIGSFAARPRPYTLTIANLPDPRGNRLGNVGISAPGLDGTNLDGRETGSPVTLEILTTPAKGTSVRGRVIGLDGLPAANVPITLTMHDLVGSRCTPADYRAGQVFTDDSGAFELDFVLAEVPFTIAALDTTQLDDDDARAILSTLLEAVGPGSADRPRLEALTRKPAVREAMLRAFNLGEISAAIAAAEGMDRATYEDSIAANGGRDGSELSVVLRFRGRGTVTGRVLSESGIVVTQAAVNLFPAIDSRELGRGVFSNDDGTFRFPAVPVGEFSVAVTAGDGRSRVISERLTTPGQLLNVDILLPDLRVRSGALRGQVVELDGRPHAGAKVYVAKEIRGSAKGVVASVTADENGFFRATQVPVGNYDLAAVTVDGRRKAVRYLVGVSETIEANITFQLEELARVRGIVRYWDGTPAANAKVGGGDRVVRTDVNGLFDLTGVPLGLRTIVAGVDALDARDNVTRLGGAQMSVQPGMNEVEIRLNAAGRIRGVVFDATGTNRVPNVRVSIPLPGGFAWVNANANGEYVFNAWPLGAYTVSAPGPPVTKKADELAEEAISAIGAAARGEGGADQAAALVGELANRYVQGTIGRLTVAEFSPGAWGFNADSPRLDFDGQTVFANIRFLPRASLSGVVVNHQDVPIGAEVKLRVFGPNKLGQPSLKEVEGLFSDPSSGRWGASGFIVGPYDATALSPLLVGTARVEGLLSPEDPHRTNVVLKFPPQRDVTGRLVGFVFNPDGTPVTHGAVHISLSSDYSILTDTNGFFDTQIRLPERDYTVIATNLETSLVGAAAVRIVGGVTNAVTVHLLDKGEVRVRVVRADGAPATNAQVTLQRHAFPQVPSEQGTTGSSGAIAFGALYEGDWRVEAEQLVGPNKVTGRGGVRVERGATNEVTIALGASGRIEGEFVEQLTRAPIAGAQVTVSAMGLEGPVVATAPTGSSGRFEILGLPVGTYVLVAKNPVTGRVGHLITALTAHGETNRVTLVERALGEVVGALFSGQGTKGVAGVEMTYTGPDRLDPPRKITTGPNGEFRFPGVPMGAFSLRAEEPFARLFATAKGALTEANSPLRVDLRLPALSTLDFLVLEADGVTPATNATVTGLGLIGAVADTDAQGRASLGELRPGFARFQARSLQPLQLNSLATTNLTLPDVSERRTIILQLSGVGGINGTLTHADGQPAANASITVDVQGSFETTTRRTVTAVNGSFSFVDLPMGSWRIQAVLQALAATASGTFALGGETNTVGLRLGGSGSVTGSLVRENGGEARGVDVGFFFTAQNGQAGFVRATTDNLSQFRAVGLPIHTPIQLRAELPQIDGLAVRTLQLASAGEVMDVGELTLDQRAPEVSGIVPEDGATDVPARPEIRLQFSETLDPASVTTNAVYLVTGTKRIATDVRLAALGGLDGSGGGPMGVVRSGSLAERSAGAPDVIILIPRGDLESKQTYHIVVRGADEVDRSGRNVSLGPKDRVGKPIARTLISRFTVRDYLPPVVLNQFPTNAAAEIEPEAPIRLEFDEPIQTNRIQISLSTAEGAVPGLTTVNPNLRFAVFRPDRPLAPNSTHRLIIRDVVDLAGNAAVPSTNEFTTIDNIGPRLSVLRLAPGQRPVANATVTLEATLERPETGAVVRFTRAGSDLGIAEQGPIYRMRVRLPAEGSVRLTARAIDKVGNAGEPVPLELRVAANDRPSVLLTRIEPASGPVETGRRFSFAATARDDATVSALRVTAQGGVVLATNYFNPPNGAPTNLVFSLPPEFVAGANIVFTAVAIDDSASASDEARLVFATRDATSPELAFDGPANGSMLDPLSALPLAFTFRDNSTNVTLTVIARGAVAWTNQVSLPIQPNATAARSLDLPLTEALAGGALSVVARVTDAAGNFREETRQYKVRNVSGPRVISLRTNDGFPIGSTNTISPIVTRLFVTFDKPIMPDSTQTNLLRVLDDTGQAVRGRVTLSSSVVTFTMTGAALTPGGAYATLLLPGWVDADGNHLRLGDGREIPTTGASFPFRVSRFLGTSITNGTPLIPGQQFLVEIRHEEPFGRWELELNGTAQALRGYFTGFASYSCTLASDATQARLTLRVPAGNGTAFEPPPIELNVRGRDGDEDQDGLPNGWEADRSYVSGLKRFDPFDPADAVANYDGDQLDNLAEFRKGTDPLKPDTDGDGLPDHAEGSIGGCPDPLVADSEGDGIRDGDDPLPCAAGESLALTPGSLSATEGRTSTNTISALGEGLTPVSIDFAPGAPKPAFVQFVDFAVSGANPVSRTLRIQPSFSDGGEHSLTFQVFARRQFTTISSNFVVKLIVAESSDERETRWLAARSGSWSQPANWSGGVPGPGTNAVIDLPGDYAVTLDQSVFAEKLRLGGERGTQALALNGRTLTLNNSSDIGTNAVLSFAGGGVIAGQGGLTIHGRVELGGEQGFGSGTFEGAGGLRIAERGALIVRSNRFGATLTLNRPTENAGEMRLERDVSLVVGSAGLLNQPSGRLLLAGAGLVRRLGSEAALHNLGQLIKQGTNATSFQSLHLRQAGQLLIEEGQLELNSGSVVFAEGSVTTGAGTLRSSANGTIDAAVTPAQIVLNGGTLTNRVAQRWPRLEMVGGSLAGPGEIQISNMLEVSQGWFLAGGDLSVEPKAELVLRRSGTLLLGRRLNMGGRATFEESTRVNLDRTHFVNSGTLELASDTFILNASFSPDVWLVNAGTVVKRGPGTIDSRVGWRNSGIVRVEAGTLTISGMIENTSRMELGPGTKVTFGGEGHHPAGSHTGGAGSLAIAAGSHEFVGELLPQAGLTIHAGTVIVRQRLPNLIPLTLTGGRMQLDQDQRLVSLDLSHAEVHGVGHLSVTERLRWESGRLLGPGTLLIETNAVAVVRAGASTLARRLQNEGELTIEHGAFVTFDSAELINRSRLDVLGQAWFQAARSTSNSVRNLGLFRKGTNDVLFQGVALHTAGDQVIQSGRLSLGHGTNETTLRVPAEASLAFEGNFVHTASSRLEGAGRFDFRTGTNVVAGVFAPEGVLTVSGGEAHFSSGFTNAAETTLSGGRTRVVAPTQLRQLVLSGGTLAIDNVLTVVRSLDWRNGDVAGTGVLRLAPTAVSQVRTLSSKTLRGRVENEGEAHFATDSRLYFSRGTWHGLANSTNYLRGAASLWPLGSNEPNELRNEGVLIKEDAGATDVRIGVVNLGSIELRAGSMLVNPALTNRGFIEIGRDTILQLGSETNVLGVGTVFSGNGTLELPSNSELLLEQDTNLGELKVSFASNTRVLGEFVLAATSGGSWTFSGGTIQIAGAIDMRGQVQVDANTILKIDDELRLHPGATVNNLGRRDGQNRSNLRVRSLPPLGGVVTGVPFDVVPVPGPLTVQASRVYPRALLAFPQENLAGGKAIQVDWRHASPRDTVIELSDDLVHWEAFEGAIREVEPGRFILEVPTTLSPQHFLRLRETGW